MKQAPFEQFIKGLLDQTAAADALRDLTKRNIPIEGSSLFSSIESMLLEQSIAAQFDPEGYATDVERLKIQLKLNTLQSLLDKNLVIPEHPDYITVKLCIKYVEDGYSLTREALEFLNVIYKKYAH
jgi:hypothetical protein